MKAQTGRRGTRFKVGDDISKGEIGLLVIGRGDTFSAMDWLPPAAARGLAADLVEQADAADRDNENGKL